LIRLSIIDSIAQIRINNIISSMPYLHIGYYTMQAERAIEATATPCLPWQYIEPDDHRV
jgi:hypothetical protein